jgi:hypothetical protein
MAERPSHGRSRDILWRSAYTVLRARKTSALFCSTSGAGSGTESHRGALSYLDERPLISITRALDHMREDDALGRPTSRRSVDTAGSSIGATAQKTPSLSEAAPVKRARMPHRGGHRFESPPLHQVVRTNRRDFLRHRIAPTFP